MAKFFDYPSSSEALTTLRKKAGVRGARDHDDFAAMSVDERLEFLFFLIAFMSGHLQQVDDKLAQLLDPTARRQ